MTDDTQATIAAMRRAALGATRTAETFRLTGGPTAAQDAMARDAALLTREADRMERGPSVAELVAGLDKVLPLVIHDTADYAELFFGGDDQKHRTQAMTMNPQDWLDLQAVYERAKEPGA